MGNKKYFEEDLETGELKEVTGTMVPLQPGDYVRRKEQLDYCQEKLSRATDKTPFVWILFRYGEELFKDLNISKANLTRLIYAATFCDKEGNILPKDELKDKMRLGKTLWAEFWNEMADSGILYEENGFVKVNKKYFTYGKIKTTDNYTRLFCQYIQTLYETCDSPRKHKQLSYIFKIIPYVNRKTNIVCFNPQEQDKSNIQYMRLGDFCEAIGYEQNNATRLAKELLDIKVNGQQAIGFFVSSMDRRRWIIIVNPNLYFGGLRDEVFEEQKKLFETDSKDYKLLDKS